MSFILYLLFVVSWFLHLTARVPALGAARFDLLLISALFALGLLSQLRQNRITEDNGAGKMILILCIYIIISIPLVEWPGSALFSGLPNFIKAILFYYFTITFITTEKRLQIFITVFIACQSFRIFEPVYLHLTQGYWGSFASMANWEFLDRLSGAPSDVVNPNGLAFVIDCTIPFLYYLAFLSWRWSIASLLSLPICLYALALTGSRSGFAGLIAIMIGIFVKSKNRVAPAALFLCILTFGFIHLSADQKDRYLSLFYSDTKNAATAEGRMQGVITNFKVVLRRPVFGHGIGTSREANANFGANDQPAHDLYAETAQELGVVGLVIFLFLIKSIFENFRRSMKMLRDSTQDRAFLRNVGDAMQVWLFMNIIFSFASYGLSSYEWYLFAGFSVVLGRLSVGAYETGEAMTAQLRAISA